MFETKNIEPISQELNDLATLTIDAAMKVHRTLGPGLLESVYEACLLYELRKMGLTVESPTQVPVHYEGVYLNTNLRMDILVENKLAIEIKTVEELADIHSAQLLTYLKLMNLRLGLLLNFNSVMLTDGLKRVAN